MSVVALSDLLFGDLLTETNMKPWWEKVRGYFFAISTALALSATYLTLNGVPVNCLPAETGNMSLISNFNALQGAWTNTYCSRNMPWYFSYLGPVYLAVAIVLLVASSFWLYIPTVNDSFVTFFEMEKIISETNMTLEEMQKMYYQPLQSDAQNDKHSKLRKVCVEIWEGERNPKLVYLYQIRNCILIVCSVISGSWFIHIAHWMISHGDRFRCNITIEDVELLNDNQRFPVSFVCVSSLAYRLIIFNIIFLISVFAQLVPILLGMLVWICRKTKLHGFENAAFMTYFWKYGRPSRSKTFSKLIKHVCRRAAVDDIKDELPEAILCNDHDLVRNFIKLTVIHNSLNQCQGKPQSNKNEKETPVNLLVAKITEIYQSKLEGRFPNNTEEFGKVEKAIAATIGKHVVGETTVDKYKPILEKTLAERRWKLFVGILNEYICKMGDANAGYKLLKDCQVDYDILDDDGCSIMHYFRYKPRLQSVIELVNEQYADMDFKLYAHSKGKSSLMKKIEKSVNPTERNVTPPSIQKKIKDFYDDFRDISNPPSTYAIAELNQRLSLIKFHNWDDDAKNFAEAAYRQQSSWLTFVTLLNCYIIPENTEDAIFPLLCAKVADSVLIRYAISDSIEEQKPFVPTAVKHLIACLTREDRNKQASEIRRRTDLKVAYKTELLRFIDKCNEPRNGDGHHNATANETQESDLSVETNGNATSSSSSIQAAGTSNETCVLDIGVTTPLIQ